MHVSDGSCMRFSGGSTLEDRCCLVRLMGAAAALGLMGVPGIAVAKRGASPALGLAGLADALKRGGSTALGLAGVGVLATRKRGDRAASVTLGLVGVGAADNLIWGAREGSPVQQGQTCER